LSKLDRRRSSSTHDKKLPTCATSAVRSRSEASGVIRDSATHKGIAHHELRLTEIDRLEDRLQLP
jgi:hypothetical protein